MSERLLEVDNVTKRFQLGLIGTGTLHKDLASWWARKCGKPDPNLKIGAVQHDKNEFFNAIENVSFTVDRGDAVALVGRNGAGKSTMLKLISRITAPTAGEIRIRGRVASLLEIGTGFHPELTGRENVYLNGALLGMGKHEIASKMDKIIEFSEVDKFIDTPVKRYSSGMYVKLAFAVAAHLDPDVMICDEVLAVGDLTFQKKCLNKMNELAQSGRAVLYVSHNMRTVSELCNRGIFLDSGHLLYDGTTEHAMELYAGSGKRESVYDLTNAKRVGKPDGISHHLTEFAFLNSETMRYQSDSDLIFRIKFHSNTAESNVRVRFTLLNGILTPIAMGASETFNVGRDTDEERTLKVKLQGLCAGDYTIRIMLYTSKPDGNAAVFDHVSEAARFTVEDDPSLIGGLRWAERKWGSFRLPELEVLK